MKSVIRKFIPKFLLNAYHATFVYLSALYYGFPSDKMVVIGVTGTKGKTSTTNFIGDILEGAGFKVAVASTVQFRLPGKTWENKNKMTMLGRNKLHQFIHRAQKAGCKFVVIETSSEGIAQNRTVAVPYDIAVFLNLSPEHIESHGSFENYKAAKQKLFSRLMRSRYKHGQKKVSIVNLDDEHAPDFYKFPADKHYIFTTKGGEAPEGMHRLAASNIETQEGKTQFDVDIDGLKDHVEVAVTGDFQAQNILAALCVAHSQHIAWGDIKLGLKNVKAVPGRAEFVDAEQPFKVIVDYAHEESSLRAILQTARSLTQGKVIALIGSTGGGRDTANRPRKAALAEELADYVVITNEDPYEEDPKAILEQIESGMTGNDYEVQEDREAGIRAALAKAEVGDVVVLTGKGGEEVMAVGKELVPWSDKKTVEKILRSDE